jgi:hypothetical protein
MQVEGLGKLIRSQIRDLLACSTVFQPLCYHKPLNVVTTIVMQHYQFSPAKNGHVNFKGNQEMTDHYLNCLDKSVKKAHEKDRVSSIKNT